MGRITQHGDQVSVQADLVNAADGSEIWGSHYDKKMSDITQLQSEITRDISSSLKLQLNGADQQKLGSAGTNNPEAYRLYLEGRQLWHQRTKEGLKKSIDLFQQAIAADPKYALAYAGLADTYSVAPSYGIGLTSRQGLALADQASRKALELDDSLPDSHASRGAALTFAWKWAAAEAEYRKAIELNPNSANAHYFYASTLLVAEKRYDEALEQFRIALSLDPLSAIINTNYAMALTMARRYPESFAQYRKVQERDPDFRPAHFKFSQLYAATGDFALAVAEFQKFDPSVQGNFEPTPKGMIKIAQLGPQEEWYSRLALSYAEDGNKEKAFEYLERAYAAHEIELTLEIRFPGFDSIRSDPRYTDLMRKIGLPE